MSRNFTGLGNGDGFRQKETASVASIADTLGNSGAPRQPCRVKGVLEKNGQVELFCAELFGESLASTPAAMFTVRIIGYQFITKILVLIEIYNIGTGDYADLCIGELRANSTNRRQRHDRVADPVRGANQ